MLFRWSSWWHVLLRTCLQPSSPQNKYQYIASRTSVWKGGRATNNRTGLRQFSLLAERVEQPWNRCNQHHSSVITVQFSCQESLGNMRISTAVNVCSMRKQKIWQISKHSLAWWSGKLVLYRRDTCFPATDLSSTFHPTLPFWQMGISVANQYA